MEANETSEIYPMQFEDKIDEYLFQEHQILPGCCSSIEELRYNVAREVAEKLSKKLIDKACSWFRTLDDKEPAYENTEDFIQAFKSIMKL